MALYKRSIGNTTNGNWQPYDKICQNVRFHFECDALHNVRVECSNGECYQTYQYKELRDQLTFHSMSVVQAIFNLISSSEKFSVYFSKLTISWQRIAQKE